MIPFKKDIAVAAVKLMSSNHGDGLRILSVEFKESILNVYYRKILMAVYPDIMIGESLSEDMRVRGRFVADAAYVKEIVNAVIELGNKKSSTIENVIFEKKQQDLIDQWKYGIENPQDKWGWTLSRERKKAKVYDIENLIDASLAFFEDED